jgi:hypothetical protein
MNAQPRNQGSETGMPEGDAVVTLTLTLTEKLSQQLWVSASPVFYDEQPDRFELLGSFDLPLPNDPMFANGTMMWCVTASDMLLLKAYEDGLGRTTTLLWDMGMAEVALNESRGPDAYVVLSSVPWETWDEKTSSF